MELKSNNSEVFSDVYHLAIKNKMMLVDDSIEILYSALGLGNTAIANLFLQKGYKIVEKSKSLCEAMKNIIINKYTECLKLIMQNANIQNIFVKDGSSIPATHYIAGHDWPEAVKMLCDAKIDLEAKNNNETMLWAASVRSDNQMVKLLLDHGANPNVEKGSIKLICELFFGWYTPKYETISLLLSAGAKIHDLDTHNSKLAMVYCIKNKKTDMFKFLVENGYDVDIVYNKSNPFIDALLDKKFDIVKLLLPYCKKFYDFGADESNALWYCIHKKYFDIAKLLIEDPSVLDMFHFLIIY